MIQASTDIQTRLCNSPTATVGRQTEIVVVCACDDNYAMPLAVMLHSAASRLGSNSRLSVYFLDGGLSENSWAAIKETLVDLPIDVHSITPDYSMIEDLHISHHVTPAAYLRLLTAELMPSSIDKAIYLDSDLLVCDDLTILWELPLGDHYVAATPDIACPWVDAKIACKNFRRAGPYLAAHRPISNYRELGLDARSPYFNSGVMLMNLKLWRQDKLAHKMLACLDENRQHIWCWDQYALNVVFHSRWIALPARWNQGAHILDFPSINACPIDRNQYIEMIDNPAIVHFTTEFKPWHFHWKHLRGKEFYQALDETSYRGWRPADPGFEFQSWLERKSVILVKWLVTRYRQIAAIWN